MKPNIICVWLVACLCLLPLRRACAQEHEAAVLALNLEKLNQLRQILDKMYEGYQLVSVGYDRIRDITSGNFQLHDLFLDALFMVSPEVKNYRRVADIIDYQLKMVREYKAARKRFAGSGAFSPENLNYLYGVYDRLIEGSLHNLQELTLVLTARQLRMSDDERIAAIDRIYKDVSAKLHFLRRFNHQQSMLGISRMREAAELQTIQRLHGLE